MSSKSGFEQKAMIRFCKELYLAEFTSFFCIVKIAELAS